ncbi:MAG: alpha/beta hydrolase [Gammaproteobacteria bacterium]|nr:alpha/beta hydrolase [Gammaproteobacteria bacterium]
MISSFTQCICSTLLCCFAVTPNANAAGKVIKDVEFAVVQGQSLKLDLYLPDKPKGSGLVVWIHGGGWHKGSKEKCFITWLPQHGYTVASISYRLSSVAKFPAQLHDCKGAVRWLRANAGKYGYNPQRIFVAGASAGGHLTALMATTSGHKLLEGKVGGNLDRSSSVQGAIDYYGPTDFILRSKTQPSRANEKGSVVYELLGGGAHEKVAAAKLASACYHVSKDDPPLLVFHGTKDRTVLQDQSQAIATAYKKAGLPIKLHIIEGASHGGNSFYSGENAKRLLEFLKSRIEHKVKK